MAPCECNVCTVWTRRPGEGFADRALTLPGVMLTWSGWRGWIAWLPTCEEISEVDLPAWCERVGVEMPTGEDLAWAKGGE